MPFLGSLALPFGLLGRPRGSVAGLTWRAILLGVLFSDDEFDLQDAELDAMHESDEDESEHGEDSEDDYDADVWRAEAYDHDADVSDLDLEDTARSRSQA